MSRETRPGAAPHATASRIRLRPRRTIRTWDSAARALASIAEVSGLSLSTRSSDDLTGTQIEALGKARDPGSRGFGRAVGTTVVSRTSSTRPPGSLLKSREAEIRPVTDRVVWNTPSRYEGALEVLVEGRGDTDLRKRADLLERWDVLYARDRGRLGRSSITRRRRRARSGRLGAGAGAARAISRTHIAPCVERAGRCPSATLDAGSSQGYGNLLPGDRYPLGARVARDRSAQV